MCQVCGKSREPATRSSIGSKPVTLPNRTGHAGRGRGDAGRVPLLSERRGTKSCGHAPKAWPRAFCRQMILTYDAAARGARLRELRWKNSAWLATADTIAGWNGFEIRNAGSGRSPVRNRSG